MAFDLHAIILAAGKATRFNTGNTKVLEKICGQEMILYPTRLLESLKIATTVVIGHQKKVVQKTVQKVHGTKIDFVTQEEQRGTGHALLCAQPVFRRQHILIMNADVPLVDSQIIKELYDRHCASNAAISFVTAHNTDPSSRYGRVIEEDGRLAIIEANEFEGDYTQHCCINAGIYIAQREFLTTTLATLQETNQEIYITDLIKKASEKNLTVTTLKAPYDTVRGVNTYEELWAVEQIKRSHLIKYWMQKGVRFFAAQNVHIDLNVTIGAGTFIGAGTHLLGATKIGKNSTVDAFSYLRNAQIDDNVMIKTYCMIEDSSIKSNASVGPFAHVGPNATIGTESFIGNFVEIKNSTMGIQSKAKHLSYLGNAVIENNVNIGAGSITCNYDGSSKHMTTIKNDAFIGTNTSLIAPVTVGTGAYTAAGSTITDDVPDHALAIARSRQINKKEYAHIIRAKQEDRDAQTASNEAAHTNNQEKSFVGAVKTNNDITLFEE